MNLKQLEVFVAIAESGSFSRGAEAACITQSTASQHVAALEDACGVRLLDRTGRGAVVTEAGKLLLAHARRVLAALRGTDQAIRQFRRAEGVELRVGGSTIPGTYLVPRAMARLRERAPGILVRVELGDSSAVLALLRDEAVELAIVGSRVEELDLAGEALGHDEILLVVGRGHPWWSRPAVSLAEVMEQPLLLREQGSGTGSVVMEALGRAGLAQAALRVAAVLSSSEAVKQAVRAGCGSAFLSAVAVAGELTRGELAAVPVEGLAITRTFTLAWRRGRTLSPAAEVFRDVLREESGVEKECKEERP